MHFTLPDNFRVDKSLIRLKLGGRITYRSVFSMDI